jgi:hypothetical protein
MAEMVLSDRRQPVSWQAVFFGLQETPMPQISYKRGRLPATVSQQAVWLCFGLALSLRDIA